MRALLEREQDLRVLHDRLARAVRGEGGALAITGPAGIGKSRLLDAFVARARPTALVLTARGGPMEQEFSFGVMRQLLERLVAESGPSNSPLLDGPAALALPAIGGAATVEPSDADAAFSIRHGLFWLVANLALDQPLVLAIDDLHWADAPSLRALIHLVTRLDGLPVLVVVTRRTGDDGDALPIVDELEHACGSGVRVRPLSDAGVQTLVEYRRGSTSGELGRAIRAATGGVPFLVTEVLRALPADGGGPSPITLDAIARIGPRTVARSLLRRLRRLPPDCLAVARAVATLNGHAELRYVAAVANVDERAAGVAVDALADAEILRPGRPCAFLHPTMRASVHENISVSARSTLHQRAADALRAAGRPASEIAPHLLVTDPSADATTVADLRDAATLAIGQGATDLAQGYLRRALREPPDPASRCAVLGELGHAEWLAGDNAKAAVEHLSEALAGCEVLTERPQRALALHRALFADGRVSDAAALLGHELERIDGVLDREVVLRMEAERASIALLHPSTVDWANEHLSGYEELAGETPSELLQLANVTCSKWARGSAAETAALGRRSLAAARVQAADPSDAIAIYEALWALAFTDEIAFTRDLLRTTVADARARGSTFGVTTSCALLSLVALRVGDTAEAEAEARSAASLPGMSDFVRPPLFGYLTQALVWRGDLDAARWAIEQSRCGPQLPEFVCLNPVFYARGLLRLATDRPSDALPDFLELGDRTERVRVRNPADGWRLGATDALIRLDRSGEAVELATEQVALARAWGTASAVGTALHGLARARAGGGHGTARSRSGRLTRELEAAEQVLAESPGRLEHARCLVDLGIAMRHEGRRTDAREPLRRGLEMARRCGATPLVGRAHDELLIAGARPRRLMFSGVESLTPSERRVAQMAASGQTNRQIAQLLFVTPKTVENQLGRVYSKLGISSRADLQQALAGDEQSVVEHATPTPDAARSGPAS